MTLRSIQDYFISLSITAFSGLNLRVGIHLAVLLLSLSSCDSTRFLKSDQSLLHKTKIVFKNEKSVKDKTVLETELLTFIKPKPNEKLIFLLPAEYLYLANSGPGNDNWFHRGMKNLGKPPSLYSEDNARSVAANMENHLRFKKGYYEARVDFITEESKKVKGWATSSGHEVWEGSKTAVTYVVSTGERYKVRSVRYDSRDTKMLGFIESIRDEAFVKPGDYIDYTTFELEKSRITLQLQNNGYVNFSNTFIELSGDSSRVNKDAEIIFEFRTPLPDSVHTRFVTGDVRVFTDHVRGNESAQLLADSVRGILFYKQSDRFLVRPGLLANSIFFSRGKTLTRDDRQKTIRKLNSLGTYRFVTINTTPDPVHDSIMHFDIMLTPQLKRWIYDGGLGGYFSTLGAARLFGFSLSSQFVNRNIFGGSEKYTLRAEAGTEIGYSKTEGFVQRTRNMLIQNNLNIPSFQDFLGLGRLANRLRIIPDRFYNNFREESTTNIGLGFNSLSILQFYSVNSFNASFGFDYTSPKNHRYVFRPLGFNLDLYTIRDTARFEQNPLILLSFQDIFGTGFLFRDFSYIYNKARDRRGNSFLAINNLELSGWEVHLLNQLTNRITGSSDIWSIGSGNNKISFARYARYELDARYNKEFDAKTSFAARFNFGIIVPFGPNSSAPFIRQFGVGGPNSLRAWNIKEPGPGGYRDPLAKIRQTPSIFVNQGDIKLELNAEYRFKILFVLDGAFFMDAGNVWTLRDDPKRPAAVFSRKFYDQIAIGAGYGLRFNFNFFIIRFDLGYKLRSPFRDEFRSSQWYTLREIGQQGLGNVQVAINYPF